VGCYDWVYAAGQARMAKEVERGAAGVAANVQVDQLQMALERAVEV
jgi:hypothetical protein